ncbi:hypothetical protein BCR43DRAFT_444225 [Syncephalastrum racemosum]|uniref:Uncharacterized protein n=1 Tax=Syncephalastrum racemosum TaxID=13706 RepID=A0A1X2H497_SYNRA|nr:hypothetical protein BCR43DRAFT_444225 [Syncephalastrum racemosum]
MTTFANAPTIASQAENRRQSSTPSQPPSGRTDQPQEQGQQLPAPDECIHVSPTLADILSDDRILRFYQCVKDIRTQQQPLQTAAMFFALCHALGESVMFLKLPHMPKIMFRQEQQLYSVNIAGAQQEPPPMLSTATSHNPPSSSLTSPSENAMIHNVNSDSHTAAASAAFQLFSDTQNSSAQLIQAALASVAPNMVAPSSTTPTTQAPMRSLAEAGPSTAKRPKKASPRDKDYDMRRQEIINDLRNVPDPDLMHQASMVDDDVKLIIQGRERSTKSGLLSPLHRFATMANLPAHYDCDFAPKNAGVYFNYEYFQLFLAYKDLEAERQEKQKREPTADPRPVLVQCRSDVERVLVNTNWEAIRRRLTIGERISQISAIVGRGFLLLSRQVSGRKLLHNFNTGEWTEFMREFRKPANHALLQELQVKYNPDRLYNTSNLSAGSNMALVSGVGNKDEGNENGGGAGGNGSGFAGPSTGTNTNLTNTDSAPVAPVSIQLQSASNDLLATVTVPSSNSTSSSTSNSNTATPASPAHHHHANIMTTTPTNAADTTTAATTSAGTLAASPDIAK